MAKAIDVAMNMINISIGKANQKKDARFYMDFIKLSGLMYLCQCLMLAAHETPLFQDEIYVRHDGPSFDDVSRICAKFGAKCIKEPFSEEEIWPITPYRVDIIHAVLDKYGTMSTDELVFFTKETEPFINAYEFYTSSDNSTPVFISREDMREYGKSLILNGPFHKSIRGYIYLDNV